MVSPPSSLTARRTVPQACATLRRHAARSRSRHARGAKARWLSPLPVVRSGCRSSRPRGAARLRYGSPHGDQPVCVPIGKSDARPCGGVRAGATMDSVRERLHRVCVWNDAALWQWLPGFRVTLRIPAVLFIVATDPFTVETTDGALQVRACTIAPGVRVACEPPPGRSVGLAVDVHSLPACCWKGQAPITPLQRPSPLERLLEAGVMGGPCCGATKRMVRTVLAARLAMPCEQIDTRVQAALGAMATCSERPSLAELANHAGVSAGRLSHLFSAATGLSFSRLATWQTVMPAVAAMVRGHTSVARLAADLGFSDASHLGRRFKDSFGLSPSALALCLQTMGVKFCNSSVRAECQSADGRCVDTVPCPVPAQQPAPCSWTGPVT